MFISAVKPITESGEVCLLVSWMAKSRGFGRDGRIEPKDPPYGTSQ